MKTQKSKFKQTEIGMIPEEWEVKVIGDLVKINEEIINKNYNEANIEYIDTSSVDKGHLVETQKLKLEEAPSRAKRIIKDHDILISTVRPNLKHFFFVKKSKQNLVGSTGFAVISTKKINPEFLYYYLTTENYTIFLTAIADAHTSTYPSFNPDVIETSFCPFPEENEQSTIAKILSDLDSKIELNQQMNKVLEEISRAIFKRWFIDFEFPNEKGKPYKSSGGEMVDSPIGKIPKRWKVSKIGKEFETILGGTPSTTNKSYWENGTIAWINSGEINKFRITEPTAYITEKAVNDSATKLMSKGTTVLAITGATLGQVSRIEIDTCANQSVIGIIENKEIPSEYIYLWIKYKIIDLISHQTGGAQQHINKNNVNEFGILLSNDALILKFKEVIRPIFKNISINCFESQNLSQIRDSLLPRLMSGKIRVPVEVKA